MNNETKKPTQYDAFFDVVTSVMEADWAFVNELVQRARDDLSTAQAACDLAPNTRHAMWYMESALTENARVIDKLISFQNEHIKVPDGDDNA